MVPCGCILSKFYIKPQLWRSTCSPWWCCILSKFYIKPQPVAEPVTDVGVVSYRNSTSNHNTICSHRATRKLYLIEILHQTTTNNSAAIDQILLYLIEILHQTTTNPRQLINLSLLYLIEILHQTTTPSPTTSPLHGCILSKFYIKPQLVPLY